MSEEAVKHIVPVGDYVLVDNVVEGARSPQRVRVRESLRDRARDLVAGDVIVVDAVPKLVGGEVYAVPYASILACVESVVHGDDRVFEMGPTERFLCPVPKTAVVQPGCSAHVEIHPQCLFRGEQLVVVKHHLIVIGSTGQRLAFLDVPKDEAVDRYVKWCLEVEFIHPQPLLVNEFDFDDEFGVYDAWESRP